MNKISTAALVGFLFFSTGIVRADSTQSLGVDAISQSIVRSHAHWIAGDTSVSKLSKNEQMRRVGLHFRPIHFPPLPVPPTENLPAILDWRNHEGNSVTPVKDQANCGACWAFAMTGGLESNVALTQKKSVSLSEQAFLDCSGVGSCDGASSLNADYLVSIGLPLESRFPYEGKDLTGFKKFNYCEGPESFFWKRHTYKIGRWGSITHDLTSIKAALASFGPIPTAMFVYEDFMNYKSGVYSYTTGEELGGHAVLLVGYNDEEKYFIVKNSWGTGWGESGFFRIAYSEVTSKAQFGISTIAYQAKQQITTPASLPNADVISDSVDRLQDSLMK